MLGCRTVGFKAGRVVSKEWRRARESARRIASIVRREGEGEAALRSALRVAVLVVSQRRASPSVVDARRVAARGAVGVARIRCSVWRCKPSWCVHRIVGGFERVVV